MAARASRGRWIREESPPTLEQVRWLQSADGQAACAAMAAGDAADTPAGIERWRQRLPAERVAAAWNQVLLRRTAHEKFTRAGQMLFDRIALEQATDEVIAAHKAARFAGLGPVADLCCGIGGDALALAAEHETVAVDWSPVRVAMTVHNAAVYGRVISGVAADVAFERPAAEAVHIDPDRRAGGPRRRSAEFGSPDLNGLDRIIRHYRTAAVKLSPGADLESLPFEAEIELISHGGECRQAVAWTGELRHGWRRATVLPSGESISAEPGAALSWPAPQPPTAGQLLLEPDPAVVRADLVGVLARRHGLAPIDPQIAWLTGDAAPRTPLLRAFRIIDAMPWSLPKARPWLARHEVGPLEIKTRGFAARPEEIRRQLRTGGQRAAVLLLTRIGREAVAILAERLAT